MSHTPCYLIDLDGTVYCGSRPIPQAAALIEQLNRTGQPYRFLTNAPERSPRRIEEKLRQMGIPAGKGSVLTAGTLAVDYLLGQRLPGAPLRVAILGNAYLRRLASLRGLTVVPVEGPHGLKKSGPGQAGASAGGGTGRELPDWVLISFDEEITLGQIRQACRLVRRGVPLLATNPDDLIPSEDGLLPHTGAILHAVTQATGVSPRIAGKPSGSLGSYFTRLFDCPAGEIRVVGDRLDTDMDFARRCGFQAWLVLTGSTDRETARLHRRQYDRCFAHIGEIAALAEREALSPFAPPPVLEGERQAIHR